MLGRRQWLLIVGALVAAFALAISDAPNSYMAAWLSGQCFAKPSPPACHAVRGARGPVYQQSGQ
jgi:hypothetical protein